MICHSISIDVSLKFVKKYLVFVDPLFLSFYTYYNLLQSGVAYLYPFKISENVKVVWCFQGV